MIHVLHSALCKLLQKLLLRFVKMEIVGQKNGKHLCEIDVNDVGNMIRNLWTVGYCQEHVFRQLIVILRRPLDNCHSRDLTYTEL